MKLLSTIIATVILLSVSTAGHARETIKILWGFSTGSTTATNARLIADEANRIQNKYTFILAGKPGAGGWVDDAEGSHAAGDAQQRREAQQHADPRREMAAAAAPPHEAPLHVDTRRETAAVLPPVAAAQILAVAGDALGVLPEIKKRVIKPGQKLRKREDDREG